MALFAELNEKYKNAEDTNIVAHSTITAIHRTVKTEDEEDEGEEGGGEKSTKTSSQKRTFARCTKYDNILHMNRAEYYIDTTSEVHKPAQRMSA